MTVAATIETKLHRAFTPSRLVVTDDSARHAGHMGAAAGGETHFNVEIVSPRFAGHSRVARQRLVYEVLADELANGVHALSVRAISPAEAKDN